MKKLTKNPSQTKKLGRTLAAELLKEARGEKKTKFSLSKEILKTELKRGALVIGLEGGLGSGKTTLLQGFAEEIGIKEKILSPTFVILKRFKIKDRRPCKLGRGPAHINMGCGLRFKYFYHIDCYRIKKPREILELGLKEIISNSQNIVAIEWSDKIKKILPKGSLILKFKLIGKNSRKICLLKRKN